MVSKSMSGGRTLVQMVDPTTKKARTIGVLASCDWTFAYDYQAVYTMGAYSPQETVYTSQPVINISGSGYRIVDNGFHANGMPVLSNLMRAEYLQLQVADRQTGKVIARFKDVRCLGGGHSTTAKDLISISVNFVALRMDDESATNEEGGGVLPAATLP